MNGNFVNISETRQNITEYSVVISSDDSYNVGELILPFSCAYRINDAGSNSSAWLKGKVYVGSEGFLLTSSSDRNSNIVVLYGSIATCSIVRTWTMQQQVNIEFRNNLTGTHCLSTLNVSIPSSAESFLALISLMLHRDTVKDATGELPLLSVLPKRSLSETEPFAVASRKPRHIVAKSFLAAGEKENSLPQHQQQQSRFASHTSAPQSWPSLSSCDNNSAYGGKIIAMLEATSNLGDDALMELYSQGNQLSSVKNNLQSIDGTLTSANTILNTMSSWTSLFNPTYWMSSKSSSYAVETAAVTKEANEIQKRVLFTGAVLAVPIATHANTTQFIPCRLILSQQDVVIQTEEAPFHKLLIIALHNLSNVKFTPIPYLLALEYKSLAIVKTAHFFALEPQLTASFIERVAVQKGGCQESARVKLYENQQRDYRVRHNSSEYVNSEKLGEKTRKNSQSTSSTALASVKVKSVKSSGIAFNTSRTQNDFEAKKEKLAQQRLQIQEQEKFVNSDLDVINSLVSGLKDRALIMGHELELQNAQIDEIDVLTDRVDSKLTKSQGKIHKLLK